MVAPKQWKIIRNISARMCWTWASAEDLDDIASEALLIHLQRKSSYRYAIIDAIRNLFGSTRHGPRPKTLSIDGIELAKSYAPLSLVELDELIKKLSVGSPIWVEKAIRLIAHGHNFKEAATMCGKTYDALYSNLKR